MIILLLENIFVLIVSLLCVILGIGVYLKNPKSATHRIFTLFCLNILFWTIANYISVRETTLFWIRLVMFFAAPQSFLFFLFVHTFPAEEIQISRKIFLPLIIFVILVTGLTFSPALFSHLEYRDNQIIPVAGPAMLLFILLSFGSYFAGIFYAIKKLRIVKKKIEKLQWQFISFGLITTFILVIAFNFIAVVIFKESRFIRLGPIFFLPFILGATIAITRYSLFGIRVILTEILIAVIGILLTIQILTAPSFVWKIINGIIFILFSIFSYLLIRGVFREIERREELERISRAKSEFISITSHQLRTPLSAIKGYLSMIFEGIYGQIPEKIKQPLKNVFVSNERLIKLVNDLLDISRIEAGKMELKLKRENLEHLIEDVISELEIEAKKKGLYLKFERPKERLPEILIDKEKIRQVILNIVDNAIKYTKEGGTTIRLKRIGNYLQIAISDTGIGMTKEEITKLFESFSRGIGGRRSWAEGAGLGLYISKKLIDLHQGRIWAESEGKGKGSTFYVELPIR
jgi:signal transduction histidine kinase